MFWAAASALLGFTAATVLWLWEPALPTPVEAWEGRPLFATSPVGFEPLDELVTR